MVKKSQKDWAILPFNLKRFQDKYLISNYLGGWAFINKDEFRKIASFNLDEKSSLFDKLYSDGVIIKQDNLDKLISNFRNLNAHLFFDVSLHIAVVTTRCNLRCSYCQTSNAKPLDMNLKVASKILEYLENAKNRKVVLEFQGGEPLLNWGAMSYLIKNSQRLKATKDLFITLVSNLILLDKKKTDFLVENDVRVCTSLDGPKELHNKNRCFPDNKGTYEQVTENIEKLNQAYRKNGQNIRVEFLPTITRYSLSKYKEIIDEYVKRGRASIALRPVKKVGVAEEMWKEVGYEPEDFMEFWKNAMDYIIELNKKGVHIRERIAIIILTKIIRKDDLGYVDLMNPCGAGRCVLTYMPNGSVYPCDEARMINEDIFKLGNILKERYEDLVKKDNFFFTCEASLMQLWDYASAYLPWNGTCPVMTYQQSGNLIPKIRTNFMDKILTFQFDYIFNKLAYGGEEAEVLKKWVGKEGLE